MPDQRITFGFVRTECACEECALNCQFIPGYLIPTDLEAMARHLGYENVLTFALENLLASPGATVMANGELFQIPTLVPARQANGVCQFLTADKRCVIHAVSPFGCAFFDAHQSQAEADRRSQQGLAQIARAWETNHPYARIWQVLQACGRTAPSPVTARQRLQVALVNCSSRIAGTDRAREQENAETVSGVFRRADPQ